MPSDKLIAKKQDGIGRMILNNPERHNAISLEMWEAALEAMAGFSADPAVRVMVLTGAGSKAFASGADISKFRDERQEAEALAHYQKTTAKAYAALQAMAIPTIATVRGYCIGGGTAVAVCCDIRICNEGARFGVPAAKLGLGYGLERSTPLIDLVGPAFARRCSSPAASSAPRKPWAGPGQPRRCGRSAEPAVQELARTIAGNAPLTVRCSKLVVGEALRDAALRDVAATERAVAACFASND